jgi:iron-sulfur cluster repair protein YtfE (RIC family)
VDPTQLLKKQHRGVEDLFKKIDRTEEADERRKLLHELAQDLELHMRIEETMFYPAVRELETKKADEMVLEAYEEHAVVKLVVAKLPEVDVEDERFEAKMSVLQELIEHHVEEEEKEMFKLAKKLGAEELDELGERMMAEVEAVKGPAAAKKPRAA